MATGGLSYQPVFNTRVFGPVDGIGLKPIPGPARSCLSTLLYTLIKELIFIIVIVLLYYTFLVIVFTTLLESQNYNVFIFSFLLLS